MKPCSDFEQTCQSSTQPRTARRWIADSTQYFQECAFARAISADDSDNFPAIHLEAYVTQGPEFLDLVSLYDLAPPGKVGGFPRNVSHRSSDHFSQLGVLIAPGTMAEQVSLRETFNGYNSIGS